MELKDYIETQVNGRVLELELAGTKARKAKKIFDKTDLDNAKYNITLTSLWFGEAETCTTHIGTLEQAVKSAEDEFKKFNHRSDVQATWEVNIQLGEMAHHLPEEYWKKYKSK